MNKHSKLSSVLKPVSVANGLPNEHYVDPAVFAEERESVLFANWSGIGFGKDIPEAGDAKPVDFLGMPLSLNDIATPFPALTPLVTHVISEISACVILKLEYM